MVLHCILTDGQKLERLARIRDNQRKSRARKQEYIQELEQKLATSQKQTHQQDIDYRISLQRLENENAKLRQLLARLGVSPTSVDDYLRGQDNPVVTQKVAIPALRRPEMSVQANPVSNKSSCGPSACGASSCGPSACTPSQQAPTSQCRPNIHDGMTDAATSLRSLANGMAATEADREPASQERLHQKEQPSEEPAAQRVLLQQEQPQSQQPQNTSPSSSSSSEDACECAPSVEEICGCGPSEGPPDCWPKEETALNTTLCAVAGELIRQYNTRGVDIAEIRQRLWAGFRKGLSAEEGCRVQNQVLFEVLNEISGNLS